MVFWLEKKLLRKRDSILDLRNRSPKDTNGVLLEVLPGTAERAGKPCISVLFSFGISRDSSVI